MGRYDKITPMLYGANLHKGKIDLIANHKYFVFFIVNNTSNTDYINNELLKFIMAGCESFHFCGKYTPVWKSTLTNLHRQVYPNLKSRLDDDNACFGVSENDSYAEKCNGYIPAELIDEKDT